MLRSAAPFDVWEEEEQQVAIVLFEMSSQEPFGRFLGFSVDTNQRRLHGVGVVSLKLQASGWVAENEL
jgi:hypothetical protein